MKLKHLAVGDTPAAAAREGVRVAVPVEAPGGVQVEVPEAVLEAGAVPEALAVRAAHMDATA